MIEGMGRGQPPRAVSTVPATPPNGGVEAVVRGGTKAVPGLSGIARDLAAAPPVDAAKVERLRAAVAGGSYRVDPDAIAAAMIAQAPAPPRE